MFLRHEWASTRNEELSRKIGKNCIDIGEANHALQSVIISNSKNGNPNISLLWLLTEQQSNAIKQVIQKIRFPTGFSLNI